MCERASERASETVGESRSTLSLPNARACSGGVIAASSPARGTAGCVSSESWQLASLVVYRASPWLLLDSTRLARLPAFCWGHQDNFHVQTPLSATRPAAERHPPPPEPEPARLPLLACSCQHRRPIARFCAHLSRQKSYDSQANQATTSECRAIITLSTPPILPAISSPLTHTLSPAEEASRRSLSAHRLRHEHEALQLGN